MSTFRTLALSALVLCGACAPEPAPDEPATDDGAAPARAGDAGRDLMATFIADRMAEAAADPRFRARAEAAGFAFDNPGERLHAAVRAGGISIGLDDRDAQVRIRTRRLRCGDAAPWELQAPALGARDNRVDLTRASDGVTERYLDGKPGLEQVFEVERSACPSGDEVAFELEVDGLAPVLAGDGERVELRDAAGVATLGYGYLAASDAGGRTLDAKLDVVDGTIELAVDVAGAEWPIFIDPLVFTLENALNARESTAGEFFGTSVAMSGSTAVIGVPNDTIGANVAQGAAHVYVLNASAEWEEQQKLVAAAGAAADGFGASVAISGTTIVVGAPNSDAGGANFGAAVVFSFDGTCWNEQATLTAADLAANDKLGASVAAEGNLAVVGAPFEGSTSRGAAYVFSRSGTTWTLQQKLLASDGAAGDQFGSAVALFGAPTGLLSATALIAAPPDDGAQGSVYRFEKNAFSSWTQAQKLRGGDTQLGDQFGFSVDIDERPGTCSCTPPPFTSCAAAGCRPLRRAIIGAPFDDDLVDDTVFLNEGSAYIFHEPSGGAAWTQQQKLSPADLAPNDQFGTSVAIDDNLALAGAVGVDTIPTSIANHGAAYTFSFAGGTWSLEQKRFETSPQNFDNFGVAVDLAGVWTIVGANNDDNPVVNEGTAWPFVRVSGGIWVPRTPVTANDYLAGDAFGTALATDGTTAIVGVPGWDRCQFGNQGAVYVFTRQPGGWSAPQLVTAPDGAVSDGFGASVAVTGDIAIVGAPGDDVGSNPNQGSAYQLVRNASGTWVYQQKLTAFDGAAVDELGRSVAVTIDGVYGLPVAAVGAWLDDNAATDTGSVYIYVRIPGDDNFDYTQKLVASDGALGDSYGFSLALATDRLIVGAPYDNGAATDQGSAYVYDGPLMFTLAQKLLATAPGAGDALGWSVAIDSDTAFVGAPLRDVGGVSNRGAVHLFRRQPDNTWPQVQEITVTAGGSADDQFGTAVAASETELFVGSPKDDVTFVDQGSAFVYLRGPSAWSLDQQLVRAAVTWGGDRFGASVAVGAKHLLVGAPFAEIGVIDEGLVSSFSY